MVMTISDAGGARPTTLPPPEATQARARTAAAPAPPVARQQEPSYHPQVQAVVPDSCGPSSAGGAYGIPEGQTLSGVAGGPQAQPFDVTLSQLATAVYETRGGPPCGWTAVTDAQLEAQGVADPQAWREQYLSGGDQLNEQEFVAEVYTDGQGNYVLSYRGTADGAADWINNFTQGTGFETPGGVDKFSGLAVDTANAFEQVFGNGEGAGGESTNLAMTGHSQGGGLASAGSLATGVPAVTFDASGLHPNTLDRMGLTSSQARDIAEGGQIRAYSLDTDLLTQAQESGPVGLLAPDALGTSIVVEPSAAGAVTLPGDVAGVEFGWGPVGQAIASGIVGGLQNNPLTAPLGDLVYSAASHNPNVLTDAMIAQQPWQPGYRNPSDPGKALQGLIPDAVHDAIAIGTHEVIDTAIDVAAIPFQTGVDAAADLAANAGDFAADVGGVVRDTLASGDIAQGIGSLAGDAAELVIDSTGDLLHAGADATADVIDEHVPGVAGDVVSDFVRFGGDVANTASEFAGDAAEAVGDFGGWLLGR